MKKKIKTGCLLCIAILLFVGGYFVSSVINGYDILVGRINSPVQILATEDIQIITVDNNEFGSEGGEIKGIYVKDDLSCIEVNLYRSMYQTNEKYFIYDNIIYYEIVQYIYENALDMSQVSAESNSYLIIENEVYRRTYSEEDKEVLVTYDEENRIIKNLNEYMELLENSKNK